MAVVFPRSTGPCRVLIVDDHQAVRTALSSAITSHGDATVVGEAADGSSAVRQALRTRPNVVVMDIDMPVFNGVEAARAIRTEQPHVHILLLTATTARKAAIAGVLAGASGLLFKGGPSGEVIAAVLALGVGQPGPGRDEMQAIRSVLLGETDGAIDSPLRDVLRLVLDAATDGTIIERLGVTAEDVQAVVSRELVAHGIARPGNSDRRLR